LSVINIEEDLRIQKSREISLESNVGTSSSDYAGSKDLSFDAYYYDRFISNHWRPFVHTLYQRGEFSSTTTSYGLLGIGLNYKAQDINAKFEINTNNDLHEGASFHGALRLDDYWKLDASLDSNSSDTPLLARKNEISTESASLGITYRFHESREIDIDFGFQKFSDGNNRDTQTISGRQRLYTTPSYSLDGTLLLYQQRNSDIDAPYFNPQKSISSEATLIHEWQTYLRYERSFRQRFSTTIGATHQQGFRRGTIWSLAYEHNWDIDKRFSFSYGISFGKSLYDGNKETVARGFLTLNKRF